MVSWQPNVETQEHQLIFSQKQWKVSLLKYFAPSLAQIIE